MKAPHCPICRASGSHLSVIARYSVEQSASHFCTATRNSERNARLQMVISRLWGQGYTDVLRCADCGFGFGHPYVGGDEAFYAILHEQRGYPRWRWEYDIALRHVVPLGGDSRRALDIGAGSGQFLKALGTDWARFAVEGSETTREVLRREGINVFPTLDAIRGEEWEAFHLISLFQVLEHIAPFEETLRHCRRLIQSNGRLVISVPDGDAMVEQERVTGCADMPPNHINKFTPGSLQRALNASGFAVVETVHERPSVKTIMSTIDLMVRSDATRSTSLAAWVYRFKKRRVRAILLAFVAVPTGLRLLPRWRYLLTGGSFLVIARPA
jgi:SAM-dependent methyltransferase